MRFIHTATILALAVAVCTQLHGAQAAPSADSASSPASNQGLPLVRRHPRQAFINICKKLGVEFAKNIPDLIVKHCPDMMSSDNPTKEQCDKAKTCGAEAEKKNAGAAAAGSSTNK